MRSFAIDLPELTKGIDRTSNDCPAAGRLRESMAASARLQRADRTLSPRIVPLHLDQKVKIESKCGGYGWARSGGSPPAADLGAILSNFIWVSPEIINSGE